MDQHKVWSVVVDSNSFATFNVVDQSRLIEIAELFVGCLPLAASWKPIEIELFEEEKGDREKPLADFMMGFTVPLIGLAARTKLEPLIGNNVEFLELRSESGNFYVINVLTVDCLDVERSVVERFRSGRVMNVNEYALHWERLEGTHLYRIKELGLKRLLASDTFKGAYEVNDMTGLMFRPVPLAK